MPAQVERTGPATSELNAAGTGIAAVEMTRYHACSWPAPEAKKNQAHKLYGVSKDHFRHLCELNVFFCVFYQRIKNFQRKNSSLIISTGVKRLIVNFSLCFLVYIRTSNPSLDQIDKPLTSLECRKVVLAKGSRYFSRR